MNHAGTVRSEWGSVLLLGGGGMLGRQWRRDLDDAGASYQAPASTEADLARPETIASHVTEGVGLVVNGAAFTDVDACEDPTHWPIALQVNGDGVGALARRCREVGACLLHYSTDYVFDGRSDRPYGVDDPVAPINAYGRSKATGEQLVRASGCEHLIVRTSWLYAPWGKNFVRTMARLLREKPTLSVVNDQHGCPTAAAHLAEISLRLLRAGQRGTFHATDGGRCTWFDFASEIGRLLASDCRVEPCSTDRFPRPAPRPAFSVLDTSDTEAIVGRMPGWRDNLAATLPELEADPS